MQSKTKPRGVNTSVLQWNLGQDMRLCKDITALLISVSTVIQNWVAVERVFTRSNAVEIYIKLLPVKDLDTATSESLPP